MTLKPVDSTGGFRLDEADLYEGRPRRFRFLQVGSEWFFRVIEGHHEAPVNIPIAKNLDQLVLLARTRVQQSLDDLADRENSELYDESGVAFGYLDFAPFNRVTEQQIHQDSSSANGALFESILSPADMETYRSSQLDIVPFESPLLRPQFYLEEPYTLEFKTDLTNSHSYGFWGFMAPALTPFDGHCEPRLGGAVVFQLAVLNALADIEIAEEQQAFQSLSIEDQIALGLTRSVWVEGEGRVERPVEQLVDQMPPHQPNPPGVTTAVSELAVRERLGLEGLYWQSSSSD